LLKSACIQSTSYFSGFASLREALFLCNFLIKS
jgi:hypothetical protein